MTVMCRMPRPFNTGPPETVGGSDDDAEEEAWLDALEAGQVDDRGYLPQKRDPGNLTARQVWREEHS